MAPSDLFLKVFGFPPERVTPVSAHASQRRISRLEGSGKSAIGVENLDRSENRAFLNFTKHFLSHGLPVPKIYGVDESQEVYLLEDLGETTLYDALVEKRTASDPFPASIENLYRAVLSFLPKFQILAGKDLDYSNCHQREQYGRESILWDMLYFRKSFLEKLPLQFSESSLQADFESFADFLSRAENTFFMYRDFQSRNIMIRDGGPFFIDYQAGRRGPLQYDVVSLLFQSSADIPDAARSRLLDVYLVEAARYAAIDSRKFLEFYNGFVLIRMMQVLGTYGNQGLSLGKQYFIDSIPLALKNIRNLISCGVFPKPLLTLEGVLRAISEMKELTLKS